MKSLPVPRCRIACRAYELLSCVRAEIDYQRAVPQPAAAAKTASLAAAAATLPHMPQLG